jgi:PKD repeat protein
MLTVCAAGGLSSAASCPEIVAAIETSSAREALGASEALILTGHRLEGDASRTSRIEVFNRSLVQLGSVELPDTALAIEVGDSSAAVVVGTYQGPLLGYHATDLFVLDLTDPSDPETVTSQPVSTRDIERVGNLVWIAEEGRLRAHDLSTWALVTEVELAFDAAVGDLDTATGLLWLRAGDRACAVDVSNPGHPGEAVCSVFETRQRLSVESGVALSSFTTGPSTLEPTLVGDVSEPTDAVLLGEIPQPAIRFDGRWALAPAEVWDLADPRAPLLIGRGQRAEWCLMDDGMALRSTSDQLAIVDLVACAEAPPVADFAWTPSAPVTGEPVQLKGMGSPGGDTWLWTIDDVLTLTGHTVEHSFQIGGHHTVRLTRSSELGEDTATHQVFVRGVREAAGWTIPAVAHLDGFGGVAWRTELTVQTDSADATAFFVPRDRDEGAALGKRIPRTDTPVTFPSALQTLFGVERGAGALTLGGAAARATLVGTSSSGEYRQSVPLLKATAGERFLVGLREDEAYRTNLGLVSQHGERVVLDVDLFSLDGAPLAAWSVGLEPYEPVQLNRPLAGVGPAAYVRITPTPAAAGARFVAYSSVVDNVTGDAAFASAVRPSGDTLWVPAAAHTDGFSGTRWRSEVTLCAAGAHDARFRPLFAARGSSEPTVGPLLELASGVCARYPDAVRDLFGVDGVGAIRIGLEAGELIGFSRTFTPAASGTYGQAVPVLPAPTFAASCRSGYLLGLEESADARTNVGVVNAGTSPAWISLHLFDGEGVSVGSTLVELPPDGHQQIDRIFAEHTATPILGGFVQFSAEPDTTVLVYASVVREDTGDPIFVAPSCP